VVVRGGSGGPVDERPPCSDPVLSLSVVGDVIAVLQLLGVVRSW
jgi:hypothetical protein